MKNQTFQFAAYSGFAVILLSTVLLSCQDRDSMPASLKAENPTGTILKSQDLFLEDGKKDTTKLPPKKDRQYWLETEDSDKDTTKLPPKKDRQHWLETEG